MKKGEVLIVPKETAEKLEGMNVCGKDAHILLHLVCKEIRSDGSEIPAFLNAVPASPIADGSKKSGAMSTDSDRESQYDDEVPALEPCAASVAADSNTVERTCATIATAGAAPEPKSDGDSLVQDNTEVRLDIASYR